MPKPKSKAELLSLSKENFERLFRLIEGLSEEEKSSEFPKGTMNRTIRDVLAHLHHWHIMLLGWYKEGMKGIKPAMPSSTYTWKETPALNRMIWEKYQNTNLSEISQLLDASYHEVQKIIEKHSNEELFEKKRYKWTGSTSLAAYLIANSSSHYLWAYRLIKKQKGIQ